ncbi:uncharacterized protein T551_00432 [Pneumocystis jirovecii RU7]|uniref:Mmc1 C-terminal domain-containing protein n=1 Tax=Pneumocystis jirovecii (strain RU7) TaxID=1408657 RepID=A0A0W4ZVD7_PNEJ7|nr:uncharacterized protein T551_00432 [Pneumocystis jirovecii RU7]KTW32342.1 hypothetical protein T551_00432 [Pneumocystis jirovecii RU7]
MDMCSEEARRILDQIQNAFSWNEVALKHISRAKDLMDRRIPARISISPAESCLSGRIPIVDVLLFDPFSLNKKIEALLESRHTLFFMTDSLKKAIIRYAPEARMIKNDDHLIIEIPHYFLEKNNIELIEHRGRFFGKRVYFSKGKEDPIQCSSFIYDRSVIYCQKISLCNLLILKNSMFIIEAKPSTFPVFRDFFDNVIPISSLGVKSAIKNLSSSSLNISDYENLLVYTNYSSLRDLTFCFKFYDIITNVVIEIEKIIKNLELEIFEIHSLKQAQDILIKKVDTWVEDAYKELFHNIQNMNICWVKLKFWKLFWRVDDVLITVKEIVQNTFLVDSEAKMYFLIGQVSNKYSIFLSKSPINILRKKILGHPLYILSRISQVELLKSIFMISGSGFLTIYLYIICNFSLYSSISMISLGIACSFIVLRSSWNKAKRNFENEMIKEGKLGLQMIEENLRSIIKNEKFYILEEKKKYLTEAKKILEKINSNIVRLN